jgi:spore coat polysaccharide biosynthesis protein SpsF
VNRTVLVMQARMGSTRLPGKSLLDLAGAPLVGRILERVKRVRGLDAIVVATTEKAEDEPLVELAQRYGVDSFRGSETDLVDRYYQAAKAFGADTVLRLPADNPCSEPEAFERLLDEHRAGAHDFTSNLMQVDRNGWPDGIGVEAFAFAALEEVWRTVDDAYRREHVAVNFYDYVNQRRLLDGRFAVGTVECPPEWRRPDLVLDVNTPEEYAFIRRLYDDLYPGNPRFHITDIIHWYDTVYQAPERRRST